MTVDSNHVIAIATLIDWPKSLAPFFQPMRSKTNRTSYARFFPRFEQVTVIANSSDWFIALFALVVIGRSNYLLNSYLERFSNDCRKTKTKVTTPINHTRSKQRHEPIRISRNYL